MQRKPRVTSIWEWSNGGDHSEPWPPKTSTVCVMCYDSGEPGWYESEERETTSVLWGHARAVVETAVDVPDHGDALSPDREETIMTIQYER